MILFADFDGVLHSDPCFRDERLFCKLPLLEAVIRDLPHVEIVVSSTWRLTRSLRDLQKLFSPDISSRVIGVTPHFSTFDPPSDLALYPRHAEINTWLRKNSQPWINWVAVDDKSYWFKPFLKNLVICDSNTGLTDGVALQLKRKLAGRE